MELTGQVVLRYSLHSNYAPLCGSLARLTHVHLTSLTDTITPTSNAPLSATAFLTRPLCLPTTSCFCTWKPNPSLNSIRRHAVPVGSTLQPAAIRELLTRSELTRPVHCLTLGLCYRGWNRVALMMYSCNSSYVEKGLQCALTDPAAFEYVAVCTVFK